MNIIVCIKQVPESTEVKIDSRTNTLIREGTKGIINPFDTYALEEGLRLKERYGGRVTVISMGPPQAKEAIQEAISLGVDGGILLSDRAFAGADTLATSYALASAIKKLADYDLVICGKQTMDGDTAQVGPSLAEKLGLPFIAYVSKIEEIKARHIRVERLIEEGHEVMEMPLPGLITVVKEINEPRLPSLKGMMKAKKTEIPVWTANDLAVDKRQVGLAGSPTQVIRIFTPERTRQSEILPGRIESQVEQLVEKLRETRIV